MCEKRSAATVLGALVVVSCAALAPTYAVADDALWIKQFGSRRYDFANGVAVDTHLGSVVAVGRTQGRVAGPANKGADDAWVVAVDTNGSELWKRQLGTATYDAAFAVAISPNGDVNVVGETLGALGGSFKGDYDTWIMRLDGSDGHLLWKRQPGLASSERAYAVAADSTGNVHVVEQQDFAAPRVLKLNAAGRTVWIRRLGAGLETARAAMCDGDDNLLIVGSTVASESPHQIPDAYVTKLDASGHTLWTRRIATGDDTPVLGSGVAIDGEGNVFVTGSTSGAIAGVNMGGTDAWVVKYSRGGVLQWAQQFGPTASSDESHSIATDPDDNIHVVGYTFLANGSNEAWLVSLDRQGHILRSRQIDTAGSSVAEGVAADESGVYVTGITFATSSSPNLGMGDAFLAKYSQ